MALSRLRAEVIKNLVTESTKEHGDKVNSVFFFCPISLIEKRLQFAMSLFWIKPIHP
jgi:hypothetical protein